MIDSKNPAFDFSEYPLPNQLSNSLPAKNPAALTHHSAVTFQEVAAEAGLNFEYFIGMVLTFNILPYELPDQLFYTSYSPPGMEIN